LRNAAELIRLASQWVQTAASRDAGGSAAAWVSSVPAGAD
jgi:hypothetical protein